MITMQQQLERLIEMLQLLWRPKGGTQGTTFIKASATTYLKGRRGTKLGVE